MNFLGIFFQAAVYTILNIPFQKTIGKANYSRRFYEKNSLYGRWQRRTRHP